MKKEDLEKAFTYYPLSGVFISNSTGKPVGSITDNGYVILNIKNKLIRAHRAAVVYSGGVIPEGCVVDHINGIRSDNRLCNLRVATSAENSYNRKKNKNNTSGAKGVYRIERLNKWAASFQSDGKKVHIGMFDTVAEAAEAVANRRVEYHGEFARHE